jgi:hypothetical protein
MPDEPKDYQAGSGDHEKGGWDFGQGGSDN